MISGFGVLTRDVKRSRLCFFEPGLSWPLDHKKPWGLKGGFGLRVWGSGVYDFV